ncbi:hypothetical protein Q7P35_012678 [Cladosporium inversicolor]
MIYVQENKLVFRYDDHILWVEAWGDNSLRVRATKLSSMPERDWALTELVIRNKAACTIETHSDGSGSIHIGKVQATISKRGKLTVTDDSGRTLLEEGTRATWGLPLHTETETVSPDEKIYGMGRYQQPFFNLKGTDLKLAHRNSQASRLAAPFFGRNVMSFESFSSDIIDFWITAAGTPAEIVQTYARVTGYAPMIPEHGLGFWQCKLRYETQEELLEVVRDYKEREVPLDLIVIDYFHWKHQGDWSFDPEF